MVTRANRWRLGPALIAVGLGIGALLSFGAALAAERNTDARSDRAVRNSQTGLDATMKKMRKKEAAKNAVAPKKKGTVGSDQ